MIDTLELTQRIKEIRRLSIVIMFIASEKLI